MRTAPRRGAAPAPAPEHAMCAPHALVCVRAVADPFLYFQPNGSMYVFYETKSNPTMQGGPSFPLQTTARQRRRQQQRPAASRLAPGRGRLSTPPACPACRRHCCLCQPRRRRQLAPPGHRAARALAPLLPLCVRVGGRGKPPLLHAAAGSASGMPLLARAWAIRAGARVPWRRRPARGLLCPPSPCAQVYMLPEGSKSGSLHLYRATDFPTGWERERVLLQAPLVDASLAQWGGRWWMFASNTVRGPPARRPALGGRGSGAAATGGGREGGGSRAGGGKASWLLSSGPRCLRVPADSSARSRLAEMERRGQERRAGDLPRDLAPGALGAAQA
jgi:hypothetical protein